MRDPIRVLVIDDSAFTRRTLIRMLESSPLIEVVGWARDGEDALRKALEIEVDLVTLDLEMPEMGFLHQLFAGPDWTGDPAAATRLTVIYVPFRTPSDLGLPAGRSNGPWMMLPGEGTAHIMISG